MVDISRHLEKAEEAVKKKNFRFAIQLYHQLLDLKPDEEAARRGLHQALDRFANYRPGNQILGLISSLGPRISVFFSRLAKNHSSEARAWERVLAVDPQNKRALLALSVALEKAQYFRSAHVTYEHLARLSENDAEAWKRAGSLKHRLGNRDEALACYEKALQVNPRDQDALRARKNLAAEGALAKSTFKTAESTRELIKDKDHARDLERSQRVLQTEDHLQEELTSLERKLAEKGQDPGLLLRKAEVTRKLGDNDGAIEILKEMKSRGEAGFDALRLLGDLRIERRSGLLEKEKSAGAGPDSLGQLEEDLARVTEEVARDLANAHPTDSGLRFRLGEALERRGKVDEAIAEYQSANKDPRFRTEATIRLARAFRTKGLADLSVSQYRKALETLETSDDRGREVLYELGDLLEEKGDHKEALEKFSLIYEVDITFKDVSDRIERLTKTLGN